MPQMVCLALVALAAACGVAAAEDCTPRGDHHTIVEIVDGATVTLDDGRMVRLAGLLPPVPPLDIAEDAPWPLAEEARRRLADLIAGRAARVATTTKEPDRHGRIAARLFRAEDELWIGGAMVADGLARVGIATDACTENLLQREARARADRRGVWSHPAYAVASADDPNLADRAGRFAIVEGTVLSVGKGRRVVFLNFGKNWRKDFTATLYGTQTKRWRQTGLDPVALTGVSVRIRGWLENQDGALIRVNTPQQIERLDAPAKEAREKP